LGVAPNAADRGYLWPPIERGVEALVRALWKLVNFAAAPAPPTACRYLSKTWSTQTVVSVPRPRAPS
jgi:hypothetical protein